MCFHPIRVTGVGVTELMLFMGFLTILSMVLGIRNRRYQPKYRASGWMLIFHSIGISPF